MPRAWFPTSTGVSGVGLNFVFNRRAITLEYYIGSSSEELNSLRFEAVRADREYLEGIVGESLNWEDLEGRKASRIALYGPEEPSVLDRKLWSAYLEWFGNAYSRMLLLKTDKMFTQAISRT